MNFGAPSASSAANAGKHYALLVRRGDYPQETKVIIKGEPRVAVEEALEWMLERTASMVHDLAVRLSGRMRVGVV